MRDDIDISREIRKLYNEKKTFRGHVIEDIAGPFAFFGSEFAQENNIDGHEVKSVIVNDYRGVNLERYEMENNNSEGVMRSRVILYCRMDDISGLRRELALRLNGKLYTVQEFHAVGVYVWRIVLEENE